MLQHNPILFTLGYLLVALIVLLVPQIREVLIIIAYVLMALVFIAMTLAIALEAWDRRKK
jgi:membrane protein DedA with SNARE-associated domain